MDVHCSTCGEPWDTHYLRHDAIYDTGLTPEATEVWRGLKPSQKLADRYRKVFRAAGWEFGLTIHNVVRCPCCPKDAKPNPERVQAKAVLEQLLGGDEDGLAATLEDFNL